MVIFHCYVSSPEGNIPERNSLDIPSGPSLINPPVHLVDLVELFVDPIDSSTIEYIS